METLICWFQKIIQVLGDVSDGELLAKLLENAISKKDLTHVQTQTQTHMGVFDSQ